MQRKTTFLRLHKNVSETASLSLKLDYLVGEETVSYNITHMSKIRFHQQLAFRLLELRQRLEERHVTTTRLIVVELLVRLTLCGSTRLQCANQGGNEIPENKRRSLDCFFSSF